MSRNAREKRWVLSDLGGAASSLSVSDQVALLREHYERLRPRGYVTRSGGEQLTDADCYIDNDVPGGIPFRDRPAGEDICRHASGGDMVMMASLDRGFCGVEDCADQLRIWMDWKVALYLVEEDIDSSTDFEQDILREFRGLPSRRGGMLSRTARVWRRRARSLSAFSRR